ncbi:TetR/AcrR family transcriptional regulator [Hyphobacterium indicum]|uniref:TetR/AcrR family transcriptional regulator n=1 Tax=Hyphobacterium indicum TaxID=2162714 RepID=UPI000D642361|nr:helix-turn-helix domain-containing protein [Hyphobacterium indicum]
MSRREEAKEFNRARIRAAAEDIIRRDGIAQLSMRRLAEQADVSLRTPYNLFGSKADVLIALLDEAECQLSPLADMYPASSAIARLLGTLAGIETFFAHDEEYFRGIYAAIMTSDHHGAREAGVGRTITTAQQMVARAAAQGELRADTDTAALGRYCGIALLAVLGMWGSGFLSISQCIAQTRRTWLAALLHHASEQTRAGLLDAYYETCGKGDANDR